METLGTCPLCGGEIQESDKAYGCSNWRDKDGACKHKVWKTIAKHEVTPEEAMTILNGGTTELITDFVSRNGDNFSATLHLVDGETKMTFPPR